jgi:hypothetical protein
MDEATERGVLGPVLRGMPDGACSNGDAHRRGGGGSADCDAASGAVDAVSAVAEGLGEGSGRWLVAGVVKMVWRSIGDSKATRGGDDTVGDDTPLPTSPSSPAPAACKLQQFTICHLSGACS